MNNKESSLSSSSTVQFRGVDLKLPTLNVQKIKTRVLRTHTNSYSLVLRQPLLVSICHILKPTTDFVDSILLDKKESENRVELEATSLLELKSTLSELDALVGNGCFSTRALLERQNSSNWISLVDSMLVKFSTISELKSLAGHEYFLYPTLLMENIANNDVQRFDEIDPHMASVELLKFLGPLSLDGINPRARKLHQFLGPLSWDAKAINTMGCFVFKFLEFLGFLLHGPNQSITELASSMAALRDSPISLLDSPLKQIIVPLDQLNNLIKLTLEVIEYISVLTLLSDTEYDTKDLLSTCGNWTILSVVTCYIQITMLMQNGGVALELSHLMSNLSHILNDLKHHFTICKPQIEEMEAHLQHIAVFEDAFRNENQLSDTRIKMSRLMKSFMYSKDNCHSFIDGSTMSKVDLEVLEGKAVIFFVSDLDIDSWQLTHLQEVYEQLKEDYYKIVWVPFVLKWNEELKHKFEDLKTKMPWYIMCYDSPIAGVWYIKGRQIFFKSKPSYLIIDLRHGNQYPNPNQDYVRYSLSFVEAQHFPFKRIKIGSKRSEVVQHSTPPSLQLVYQDQHEEGVNRKKPTSGFQGLLAMKRSKMQLKSQAREVNPADAPAGHEHISLTGGNVNRNNDPPIFK